jgi:hypothetical protein
MLLAAVQVSVALRIGTPLFQMDWGSDPAIVVLVLASWAGFCASAGVWLETVASTQAQASGLGVLAANALAALGGCRWPIEITQTGQVALTGTSAIIPNKALFIYQIIEQHYLHGIFTLRGHRLHTVVISIRDIVPKRKCELCSDS